MAGLDESLFSDEFFVSFKEMMISIAEGVAEAQRALDLKSLEIQNEILTNPDYKELKELGIRATWYQLPETTAKIKVAVTAEPKEEGNPTPVLTPFQLILAPYNATYQNTYDFKYDGASEMSFKIVPVPPPVAASITLVPDLLGRDLETAKKTIADSKLILGMVSEKVSDGPVGTVIEQNPAPGVTTDIGSAVDLTIAKA